MSRKNVALRAIRGSGLGATLRRSATWLLYAGLDSSALLLPAIVFGFRLAEALYQDRGQGAVEVGVLAHLIHSIA
jgi:hypothetical protein